MQIRSNGSRASESRKRGSISLRGSRALIQLTLLVTIGILLPGLSAMGRAWLEVRSPHFTVLFDGTEGTARRIATHLEQFHMAFKQLLPGTPLEGGQPITVVATWDKDTFRKLCLPDEAKAGADPGSARSLAGRDRNYILLWLNPARRADVHDWGDVNDYFLFEEYASLIERTRINWLPFWLRVGLARFSGAATVTDTQVQIGRFLPVFRQALTPSLRLPLTTVLSFNVANINDIKSKERYDLAGESWGLVYYFLLTEDGRHKSELARYVQLLQEGRTREQAAEEAFGNIKLLEKNVAQYFAGHRAYPFQIYNISAAEIQSKLQVRSLDSREASMSEAEVMLRFGNRRGAREILQGLLRQDPNLPAAKEALGLCALSDAEYDQAASNFSSALQSDPSLVEARFYLAMIANRDHPRGKPNPSTERELRQVVNENPRFAPAFLALARLLVEEQGPSEESILLAQRAALLEPFSAGYQLSYGYLQLQAGHTSEAEQAARYVLRIAPEGQELEDAQLLLEKTTKGKQTVSAGSNDTPASQTTNSTPSPTSSNPIPEKSVVTGVVESVTCSGASRSFILDSQGTKFTFDSSGMIDFDLPHTLWIPRELFVPCKHVVGQTFEVKFRPPLNPNGANYPNVMILRESYP